jgi:hypothetical protein
VSSDWQRLAENRIHEAIERGEFADVPKGQPLDLSEYFALPEGDRAALTLLRNAGVRPPEIDLMLRAAAVEEALTAAVDPADRRRLSDELQSLRVALSLAVERQRRARREPGV